MTSTGSGLAVPDWPLSYGMLFPPMVGGVFYEHGHRMIAATVGFFTLVLSIWLAFSEKRTWVRVLGFAALGTVIAQGVLGGITVLLMLPDAVSVSHAVLSQTFFILTIILAYSLSMERSKREESPSPLPLSLREGEGRVRVAALFVLGTVYMQLILGALMRHTESGLAIPDFPAMGGYAIPPFNDAMLQTINAWRFKMNLDPVTMNQVLIHFAHRVGAILVIISFVILDLNVIKLKIANSRIRKTIITLNLLVIAQIALGAFTIWARKAPLVASVHVVIGASILGLSTLLLLRVLPLSLKNLRSNTCVSKLS